jgi:pSer/pThr/pTyr-binding forkhead associated (FHA) protein
MPKAALVVGKTGGTHPITRPLTLIGRHDPVTGIHPEIDLSKEEMGKSVSRRHARIEFRDGQFFLTEEIGTLNNTTVNNVKLETGVMTPLIDGDEIGLGAVKLTFRENYG